VPVEDRAQHAHLRRVLPRRLVAQRRATRPAGTHASGEWGGQRAAPSPRQRAGPRCLSGRRGTASRLTRSCGCTFPPSPRRDAPGSGSSRRRRVTQAAAAGRRGRRSGQGAGVRAARRPGRGGARRGPAGEVKEDIPPHGVHNDHGLRTRAARASAQRKGAPRRILSRQCGGSGATLCPEPRTMASIVKESRVKYWSRRSSSCAREGRAILRRHPGTARARARRRRPDLERQAPVVRRHEHQRRVVSASPRPCPRVSCPAPTMRRAASPGRGSPHPMSARFSMSLPHTQYLALPPRQCAPPPPHPRASARPRARAGGAHTLRSGSRRSRNPARGAA
jgi:hypothetical protein